MVDGHCLFEQFLGHRQGPAMSNNYVARVIGFVAAWTNSPLARIGLRTTLQGDLGVDGDDAAELIQAFGGTFDVDLSGFVFQRYFHPEPLLGCSPIGLLYWVTGRTALRVRPITIGDLVEAAEAHQWRDAES